MNNLTPKSNKNFYAAGTLNRASEYRIDAQHYLKKLNDPAAKFIPIWKNKNLVSTSTQLSPVYLTKAEADSFITGNNTVAFLGSHQHIPYFTFDIPQEEAPEELTTEHAQFKDLREITPSVTREESSIMAYARALLHWHRTHRYCGKCGHSTESKEAGHMRQCTNPSCLEKHYPRTDSAIIVLITYEQHCLLVRQPNWPERRYATVAGFLEPGESLEDAVAREALEETGLTLTDIKYHSSQPWPFPASIMVGFTAKATSMDFKLDKQEIEAACWLTRQELIQKIKSKEISLPPDLSISYRLIEDWFRKRNRGSLSQIR